MKINKENLKSCIKKEKNIYYACRFPTRMKRIMAWLKQDTFYKIMQWQILSRKTDYYHNGGGYYVKIQICLLCP